jgi:hypothetical protein
MELLSPHFSVSQQYYVDIQRDLARLISLSPDTKCGRVQLISIMNLYLEYAYHFNIVLLFYCEQHRNPTR